MVFEQEVNIYDNGAIRNRFNTLQTQFNVQRGKISAIISDEELSQYGDHNTVTSRLSSLIQDVTGIHAQFSEMSTDFGHLSERYVAVESRVTTVEAGVDGLRTIVSNVSERADLNTTAIASLDIRATGIASSVSNLTTELHNNYPTTRYAQSLIDQSADAITLSVQNQMATVNSRLNTAEFKITPSQIMSTVQSFVPSKTGDPVSMQSYIMQQADSIRLQASRISWTSDYSDMTETGVLTSKRGNVYSAVGQIEYYGLTSDSLLSRQFDYIVGDGLGTKRMQNSNITSLFAVVPKSNVLNLSRNANTSVNETLLVGNTAGNYLIGLNSFHPEDGMIDLYYSTKTNGVSRTVLSFNNNRTSYQKSINQYGASLQVEGFTYSVQRTPTEQSSQTAYRNNGGMTIDPNRFSIYSYNSSSSSDRAYIAIGSNNFRIFYSSSSDGEHTLLGTGTKTSSSLKFDNRFVAFQSSSAKRYKHDIREMSDEQFDCHRLLELRPMQFVYNEEVPVQYTDMRNKTLPGFIAEDVARIYPSAVITNYETGQIESWDERRIIPAMLALIQEQESRIRKLETGTSTN